MNLKILASASQDLIDGYHFYEKQPKGIGPYTLRVHSCLLAIQKQEYHG